jgi:hypothetical protein
MMAQHTHGKMMDYIAYAALHHMRSYDELHRDTAKRKTPHNVYARMPR